MENIIFHAVALWIMLNCELHFRSCDFINTKCVNEISVGAECVG